MRLPGFLSAHAQQFCTFCAIRASAPASPHLACGSQRVNRFHGQGPELAAPIVHRRLPTTSISGGAEKTDQTTFRRAQLT